MEQEHLPPGSLCGAGVGASPPRARAHRAQALTRAAQVVTGGATGIGLSITRELLALGCNVVIASRKQEALQTAVSELQRQRLKGEVDCITCNIREEADVKKMFAFAIKRFGPVDHLVNNSGGQFPAPAGSISSNGFRTVVDLNLNGTFICCREAFAACMAERGGNIVNIICDMRNGFPGMAHTGAARAGVENLTKSLAIEWAPARVRINCVAPGIITNASANAHYEKNTGQAGLLDLSAPGIPAKRTGTVDEVAAAVVFLLSPAAAYITGVSLPVDGGSCLAPGTVLTTMVSQSAEHRLWPEYKGAGKL